MPLSRTLRSPTFALVLLQDMWLRLRSSQILQAKLCIFLKTLAEMIIGDDI